MTIANTCARISKFIDKLLSICEKKKNFETKINDFIWAESLLQAILQLNSFFFSASASAIRMYLFCAAQWFIFTCFIFFFMALALYVCVCVCSWQFHKSSFVVSPLRAEKPILFFSSYYLFFFFFCVACLAICDSRQCRSTNTIHNNNNNDNGE